MYIIHTFIWDQGVTTRRGIRGKGFGLPSDKAALTGQGKINMEFVSRGRRLLQSEPGFLLGPRLRGGGRGDVGGGDQALLPKRHARFLERFNAAKEARVAGEGGVTSFGALLVDTVGRAD